MRTKKMLKKDVKSGTGMGALGGRAMSPQSQISPVLSPMMSARRNSPAIMAAKAEGQKRAILKSAVKKSRKSR